MKSAFKFFRLRVKVVSLQLAVVFLSGVSTAGLSIDEASSPSDAIVVAVNDHNGENGFFVEHHKITVREELECSFAIPVPQSEIDDSVDYAGLMDENLATELKSVWSDFGAIVHRLEELKLTQTADLLRHYVYGNRLLWCFTNSDLKPVVNEGAGKESVSLPAEYLTVGVNRNDDIKLSLPAWKKMSQVSKQKTVLHEIFWSLLRDGHINDVNQIVDLVNFFDKGRILAMQPPFILSHVARILEGKTCLFLQSVKSDYRLLSEEPALSARLTPTVKVRDPLARIEFLKNWTVKSSPDLSYQVTGASPNQRFKQVYLGQRKDLYYSDSGQIRKIPWENGYTQFDQLCNPKFMGEAGWRLMNEAELDWLIRKQWLFLIEEGMTESDFVIVSSEIFGTRTVKNLKVGTRSEPSVPSYGSTNPVYSKYFCVRQIESKQ